jgi:opacity protein-like surface antigen
MKKYLILLLAGVLSLAGALSAQTNNLVMSTSTEAVGLHYNNAWGAANITTVSLDVFDWGKTKGNSLSAAEYTILSSGGGFNSYLGGVHVVPDVSSLVKHTNIPVDQFSVFGEAAAGNSTFSSTTPNQFTFLLGGGAQYKLTPNIAWSTVDFRWGRLGSKDFYTASSGLTYFFNPQASQSLAVKRMLARAKSRQNLKVQEDAAVKAVK